MKRTYPYAGAAPAAGQQVAPGQQQPDYSAYGYGATPQASGGNNEAQQAQWHQQWQQYYAQQAAVAAVTSASNSAVLHAARPGGVQQQQPYAYTGTGGYQAYPSQQPQSGPSSSPYGYPAAAQPNPGYSTATAGPYGVPAMGHQQIGSGSPVAPNHGYNAAPASKRPRMDNGYGGASPGQPYGGQPAYPGGPAPPGMQARPGAWQGQGVQRNVSGPNLAGRPQSKHPIPGRPQMANMGAGGPSHMAGPMAAGGVPQRPSAGPNGRSRRGGQQQSGGGKFLGPQGVNAIGPGGGPARSGFGQHARNQGGRRAASTGNRGDGRQQNMQQIKGIGNAPKGPAAAKNGGDGVEMGKASLLQGRTSAPLDHPVPITAKRTFTDFKIKQIEIEQIDWQWQREDLQSAQEEAAQGEDGENEEDGDRDMSTTDAAGEEASAVDEAEDSGKTEKVVQPGATRKNRRDSSSKDTTRVRIAFVANPPPANAPTGPKALVKPVEAETQTGTDDVGVGEGAKGDQVEVDEIADAGVESNEQQDAEEGGKAAVEDGAWSPFSRGPPHLSTNRITISYASSRRRLLIDCNVVKRIEVNRAEGTMRIVLSVTTSGAEGSRRKEPAEKRKGEEWVVVKGVLIEARNREATNFAAVTRRQLEASWRSEGGAGKEDGLTGNSAVDTAVQAEEKVEDDEVKQETEAAGNDDAGMPDPVQTATADAAEDAQTGVAAEEAFTAPDDHLTLPPFFRLLSADEEEAPKEVSEMAIVLWLDDSSAETKWLRTGDVSEWLSALPGMQTSVLADPLQAWAAKVHVVDPDPPPTWDETLDVWVKRSNVGTALLRRQFVQEQRLSGAEVASEIIARIVSIQGNGGGMGGGGGVNERMASPAPSPTSPGSKELTAELSRALSQSTFDAHHSALSLGVLALAAMAREYAAVAGVEEEQVAKRLIAILMAVPVFLLFGALDSVCKEVLDKERVANARARRVNGKEAGVGTGKGHLPLRSERGVGVSADDLSAELENGPGSVSMADDAQEEQTPAVALEEAGQEDDDDENAEGVQEEVQTVSPAVAITNEDGDDDEPASMAIEQSADVALEDTPTT